MKSHCVADVKFPMALRLTAQTAWHLRAAACRRLPWETAAGAFAVQVLRYLLPIARLRTASR